MATLVLLVRHTHHHLVGRALTGRMPGVSLSSAGLVQAYRLAERLIEEGITRVQSSPQLRARQTARPLANALEAPVEIAEAVDEIDVGDWTGRSFNELESDSAWRRWNAERGAACPPHGESMRHLQARMLRHLSGLSTSHPGERIAVVTHAEPIRAVILHFRGMRLDEFARVGVDIGSVSRVLADGVNGEIVSENDRLDRLEAA